MKDHVRLAVALAAIALLSAPATATGAVDGPDMAAIFGQRQGVEDVSLSPDGTKLAFVAPAGARADQLFVVSTGGGVVPKPIFGTDGKPNRLGGCKWSANTRLVCTIYGVTRLGNTELAYFSRLAALDADGANVKLIEQPRGAGIQVADLFGGSIIDYLPEEDGNVLIIRSYVPEISIGTRLAQTQDGTGVDRLDTRTLATSIVEQPRQHAEEYITDGHGNVRIMGVGGVQSAIYSSGKVKYSYRKNGSREWRVLSDVDEDNNGFNPYGVDSDRDVAYGLEKLDGRLAAYSLALDGSMKKTLLFSHPQVDADGFVQIGRSQRIIGVSYITDKREQAFFDPDIKKLVASLSKAISNLPLIRFVDSSQDESKLLIWAGSDTDPGRYYLFDRKEKRLNEIMLTRPALENTPLATVKAVTYRAADGTMVPAYLTLPPGSNGKGLPAIVMPHGGPGARDEWGFDWLSQFFANRGYAVLQPNFRGSTGYGDGWFEKNGFQNWRLAIGDVDDGARWLISQGIAGPGKVAIVGWSYGGYAALQAAATDPDLYRAVVAIAPVTDLPALKQERANWTDYAVVSRYIGNGPHLEQGSPARNVKQIKAPVLMFHGTLDRNVSVHESELMASKLKAAGAKAQLVEYDGLDHYLEDSDKRADMLRKSDDFLRTALTP